MHPPSFLYDIWSRVSIPEGWRLPPPGPPVLSVDPSYSDRLHRAYEQLQDISFNEDLKKTHGKLLELGLVPLANDGGRSPSAQVQLAKWIAQCLTQDPINFQTESGEVSIPRTDFIFWVAAIHFQVKIFVFSTRKHPQVYSPLGPTSIQVGILWALDSFSGTSNILPLEGTKTLPRPQPPPVVVNTSEVHPPATYREEPRERLHSSHGGPSDLQPFKEACIAKAHDLVKGTIDKLVSTAAWLNPKKKSHTEQQKNAYELLYQAEIAKKTLPNGILDKAVKLTNGEAAVVTQVLKQRVEPRNAGTRQTIWHDIFKSMAHYFWDSLWDNDDPVLKNPYPYQGKENYLPYIREEPETPDDGEESVSTGAVIIGDPLDDINDIISTNTRTCTVSLNNVLHPELHQYKEIILEKIQSAQRAVSSFISDVYTFAHMATLVIAGGGAHLEDDGPAPVARFDLSRLVPSEFRSLEFNSTLSVAPVTRTVREAIETNVCQPHALRDDRFKLLNQEHLKKSYTQVVKAASNPAVLTDVANDPHPLWTKIVSEVATADYKFQPSPAGLSQTSQIHTQQAATSIENHWSAELYQKSFRYTVLNALRLRLAPKRFKDNEDRRMAKAQQKAEGNSETNVGTGQHQEPLSSSKWSNLLKDRFNELARVIRKHNMDQTAMPRVEAILNSIQVLNTKEPRRSKGPPMLIEDIHLRQQLAQKKAETADGGNGQQQQPVQLSGQCVDDDGEEDDDLCPDEEDHEHAAQAFDEQFEEEPQPDQDVDVDADALVDQQAVESSGSQIKRLFTVVNTLVHSPHITRRVSKEQVQRALLKNMDCTDQELIAARDIVNTLFPFTPKRVPSDNGYRNPTPHVVLFAPMVAIAQAFLHEVGLHRLQRRLSPQVSVGSTSALQLSSNALYEILGSSSEKQFDITGPSGQVIRGAPDAAMPANKEAVMASFFDLNRMKSICFDHNLVFSNRMTFTDRNRIRLEGKLLPESHLRGGVPLESAYEARTSKRNKSSGTSYVWAQERDHWEGAGADYPRIEQAAIESAELVKIKSKALQDAKKSKTDHQDIEQELFPLKKEAYYWSMVEKASKSKAEGKADSQQPTPVKVRWHAHQVEEEPARIDLRDVIAEARRDPSSKDPPSKVIALGGGDPGFRVMLEGQSLTLNELSCHINRYEALTTSNRFQVLADNPETEAMDEDKPKPCINKDTPQKLKSIRLPKPNRVSSKTLNTVSFTKRLQNFRQKRLGLGKGTEQDEDSDDFVEAQSMDDELSMDSVQSADEQSLDDEQSVDDTLPGNHVEKLERDAKQARAHMKEISKPSNSLLNAHSIKDVARIATIRKKAQEPLLQIESSNKLVHLRKTQELRKARAKDKAAANFKKAIDQHAFSEWTSESGTVNSSTGFCKECRRYHPPCIASSPRSPDESTEQRLVYQVPCPKTKPDMMTVIAYGAAGTGIGSRIGGSLRWGGHWLRLGLLRLNTVVALTDEYNTTRMCIFCYHRMQEATSTRLVGTELKTRTVHGSMCCHNPDCEAVRCGYAMRPRDSNAAVGILLSAMTIMLRPPDQPPWPIEPYSRYWRPASLPAPINT
ncbi:MAG: hypothetical protein J3Q66DRAFT_331003 [Benniella sp.]|nr:MAG: hypothetical protein J3Q66DRAFT_331003 [Benniella sp.]